MRRVFMFVSVVALVLASAAPGFANNSWNGYHWANGSSDTHDGDITLNVVNDLDLYGSEYTAVLTDWQSSSSPLTLNSSTPSPGGARPAACDNVATEQAGDAILGTIHMCNKAYGSNGWLGLARIWLANDGHIDAAVVLMNDSYLQDSESVYFNPVAWRHVLCQEAGHTFGLDHQKGPKSQSCMNDMFGLTSTSYQSPNAHDFEQLNAVYGSSSGGDPDGGSTCNPRSRKCQNGVQVTGRPGGGLIITYTYAANR